MAKVKYDVSDAEVRNFEVPKPGVYEAVVQDMSHGDSSSGNPMFTVVFQITKGEFKESRIWYYILTDGSQEWRLREFTDALGLKPKGTLDTDQLKGSVVQIKTAIDPARDGYDEKAKIKNVLPTASNNGASAEEEDEAPYSEWTLADLKEEAEARELEISGKATKKKLVDALEADDDEEGGDEESEEDEEEEEEEEEEEGDEEAYTLADLKEMERSDLKALIEEEELEIKVLKKTTDDQLRAKIAEALELGEDEEEEEEEDEEEEPEEKPASKRGRGRGKAKPKPEPEPEPEEDDEEDEDYSEWSIADLKAELKERGLKTAGPKAGLIKRLEKDDESDSEPF